MADQHRKPAFDHQNSLLMEIPAELRRDSAAIPSHVATARDTGPAHAPALVKHGRLWHVAHSPVARLFFAPLAIVFILVLGIVGYVLIEDLDPLDAFYYTVITISTSGFSEPRGSFTPAGKIFTSFLVMTSLLTLGVLVTRAVGIIVSGELKQALGALRMEETLRALSNHFIICGYGRLGQAIAMSFHQAAVPFVVVDPNERAVAEARRDKCLAVQGDASNDDLMQSVGVATARGMVIAGGDDATNVFIALSARQIRPDLFILARSSGPAADKKLQRAGASRTFSPYSIGGAYMAQAAIRPAVIDFFDITTMTGERPIQLEEIAIPPSPTSVVYHGPRSLKDLELSRRFGVIIVAIRHGGRTGPQGSLEFNPSAHSQVGVGDLLIALGEPANLKKLEQFMQSGIMTSTEAVPSPRFPIN